MAKVKVGYKIRGVYVPWIYRQKTVAADLPKDRYGFILMGSLTDELKKRPEFENATILNISIV